MVHKRPRGAAPKDFLSPKQRVGRKKLAPVNQTAPVVREKAVRVLEQKTIARAGSSSSSNDHLVLTSKHLTLNEIISQTRHHNNNVRREAILELKELLDKFPADLVPQLGHLLSSVAKLAADTDNVVRRGHRQLLEKSIALLGQMSSSDSLTPFAQQLGQQLRCCMTHRDMSIRSDAVDIADTLLRSQHCFDINSRRQIFISAAGGSVDSLATFGYDLLSRCLADVQSCQTSWRTYRVTRLAFDVLRLDSQDQGRDAEDISLASLIVGREAQYQSTNREGTGATRLAQALVDVWSRSSEPTSDFRRPTGEKISQRAQSILKQIVTEFGTVPAQREGNQAGLIGSGCCRSFSSTDEACLIPTAVKFVLAKMLLFLAKITPVNDFSKCDFIADVGTHSGSSNTITNRILQNVLVDLTKLPTCPIGVHKRIFHEISTQTTVALTELLCVLLSQRPSELPTLQTSVLLLLLFSEALLQLSSRLNVVARSLSRRGMSQWLSCCQSVMQLGNLLLKSKDGGSQACTLLHAVIKVVSEYPNPTVVGKAVDAAGQKISMNTSGLSTRAASPGGFLLFGCSDSSVPSFDTTNCKSFGSKSELINLTLRRIYDWFTQCWTILDSVPIMSKCPNIHQAENEEQTSTDSCKRDLLADTSDISAKSEGESSGDSEVDNLKSPSQTTSPHELRSGETDVELVTDNSIESHDSKRRRLSAGLWDSTNTAESVDSADVDETVLHTDVYTSTGNCVTVLPISESQISTIMEDGTEETIETEAGAIETDIIKEGRSKDVDQKADMYPVGLLRAILIPQICIFWGIPISTTCSVIPTDDNKRKSVTVLSSFLHQSLELCAASLSSTAIRHDNNDHSDQVLHLAALPQIVWIENCVDLAADLAVNAPDIASIILQMLLSFSKTVEERSCLMTRASSIARPKFGKIYKGILERVQEKFLGTPALFSCMSENVQTSLLVLCVHLASLDNSWADFMIQDVWLSQIVSPLMSQSQAELYFELVLSAPMSSPHIKLGFIKKIIKLLCARQVQMSCLNAMTECYDHIVSPMLPVSFAGTSLTNFR